MGTPRKIDRWLRRAALIGVGVLPAFVMRCDKAALNFQRGFFQGLGFNVSQALVEQGLLIPADGQTDGE